MTLIYLLITTAVVGILYFVGMMWYDRAHNYDW